MKMKRRKKKRKRRSETIVAFGRRGPWCRQEEVG